MSILKSVPVLVFLALQFRGVPAEGQDHKLTQLTFNDSTRDGFPYWSPDGNYILYTSVNGSSSMAMRIPSLGGMPENIIPGFASHARWSPDGKSILFESDSGSSLQIVPSSGGIPIRIDPDTLALTDSPMPCWSPDGKRIAFGSMRTIHIMDLGTRSVSALFSMKNKRAIPFGWSPDGSKVLVEVRDESRHSGSDIWVIPLDGLPRQATFLEGNQSDPAYAPDGSLIIFSSDHEGERGLWIQPARGGDPELLVPDCTEGSWSPDGSAIAGTSNRSGYPAIWRIDLDLEHLHERFPHPVNYSALLPALDTGTIPVFPFTLERLPEHPSPGQSWDFRELVLVSLADERFAWIDATVELGDSMNYITGNYGKGDQVSADGSDFPALSQNGVHTDGEIRNTRSITGRSVSRITVDGWPGALSKTGFLAMDETILSVILSDNRMVRRLDLHHPDLARPLFHLLNISRFGEKYNDQAPTDATFALRGMIYNGKRIETKVTGGKGWQASLFNDEILGTYQMEISREPDRAELEFLEQQYGSLSTEDFDRLVKMISTLRTGEMVPYYISRYGFYEGHTEYRAEPLAIAFIFGIRTLEEIHLAARGDLYGYLVRHFTQNP